MDQDYETLLELTAQCQLMDLEELRAGIKGKARVGGRLSDVELTYNAMEAEARATLQYVQDRRIARGAEGATQEDLDLIHTIAEIERQEQADRQYALALSTNPDAPPPPPVASSLTSASRSGFGFGSAHRNNRQESPSSSSGGSNWPWSTAESFAPSPATSSRSSLYDPPKPQASTSTNKATFVSSILRLPPGRSSVDCVICGDYTNQAFQAPCGCFYDRQCLTDLFDKATVDESLFPPRCCSQQISFTQVRSILSPQLVQKFETKSEEFKTPNRVYCHNSTCSRFLGPAATTEREKSARLCTQCWRTTCSFCKSASHASHVPCETDTAAQQVLALGRQEGWQSCPSCHHMVELDTGCYHMTCRCRHEFCYLCARRWKECTCPQWDENRLIAQAERRVVRDLGALPAVARPAQVEARRQDIFQMAEELRLDHECDHHISGFFKRNGSGNCESCGSWLRDFLLQCRGCSMRVCVRCRRNRL
ncbi:IBR finger protein, putative [Rhizoctonia solani AG-3 Rhs1AP]|uniref:IBR finger protein, putative n=2 Tax=Rhizoctonia solani AG-3 TaxID=1086053 RepID=X8J333_9AGAM|nr:IBR finger protein, putative [Rhizoctonia solani AG-3 Rhs1AP]KEP50614.1 putative IBR finger protein [Rhizoctonia solani 123E]